MRLATALRAPMAIGLLLTLAGCADPPQALDLRSFERPGAPNSYLFCPAGQCAAKADEDGPVVDQPAEKVLVAALKVASLERNVAPQEADAALGQLVFIQRTAVLQFPDVVRIQAIALPGGRTGIALYSQSIFGKYDFGANKTRARRWMAAIRRELGVT